MKIIGTVFVAFLLSLATPHQIPKIEISSASLNSLYKIIPVLYCKNFTLELLIIIILSSLLK